MPVTYIQTPVGIVRITEEDDFITSVHFIDDEAELVAPETPLLKSAVQQL
jgi:methylated-DNA-[protein]-cysteine S-methyltransferase